MEELIAALRKLQSSAVAMYSMAHDAHWNVEGILFVQLHDLFGKIYDDVYGSIDPISENIRKAGAYATYPGVVVNDVVTSPRRLLEILDSLNSVCISDAKALFDAANAVNEQGIANFAADRIDKHQFWAWWLKSSLKTTID